MQTLDDAWNTRDWVVFEKRHAQDVDVFWPGQALPTRSRPSHKDEAVTGGSRNGKSWGIALPE